MSHWVYILYSESTGTYYRGQTDDLKDRLTRHNSGWEKSTKRGIPWQLSWVIEKEDRAEAIKLERKLKNLSKERLIKFIKKYSEGSRVLTP